MPVLQDTSTNGTWLNFRKLSREESAPLANGDFIKLVNPDTEKDASATCPKELFFRFWDTRPMAFIAFRLRLLPVRLPALPSTRASSPRRETAGTGGKGKCAEKQAYSDAGVRKKAGVTGEGAKSFRKPLRS